MDDRNDVNTLKEMFLNAIQKKLLNPLEKNQRMFPEYPIWKKTCSHQGELILPARCVECKADFSYTLFENGSCSFPQKCYRTRSTRRSRRFNPYTRGRFQKRPVKGHSHASNKIINCVESCSKGFGVFQLDEFETRYPVVTIKCDMIYTSFGFEIARIVIIDVFSKNFILKTFVKPIGAPNDYLYDITSIQPKDLTCAPSLVEVKTQMKKIFSKKTIFVGHSLEQIFQCLKIVAPNLYEISDFFGDGVKRISFKRLRAQYCERQNTTSDRFELSKDLVDVFKASLKDAELEEVLNKIQNSSDVTL